MENIFVLIWLLIATILGQILILFIGFTFFYLILRKVTFPVLQKVAIFYGLGSGILALSMFFSICLGLHSRLSFFPVLFVSVFLFCYLSF